MPNAQSDRRSRRPEHVPKPQPRELRYLVCHLWGFTLFMYLAIKDLFKIPAASIMSSTPSTPLLRSATPTPLICLHLRIGWIEAQRLASLLNGLDSIFPSPRLPALSKDRTWPIRQGQGTSPLCSIFVLSKFVRLRASRLPILQPEERGDRIGQHTGQ